MDCAIVFTRTLPRCNLPATFQILDTQDQLSAIKRLLKSMNIDTESVIRPNKCNTSSTARKRKVCAHDIEPSDPFQRRMQEIFAAYEAQCQREGVVDFPELLLRSYEVLNHNEALRTHYQNRFHTFWSMSFRIPMLCNTHGSNC